MWVSPPKKKTVDEGTVGPLFDSLRLLKVSLVCSDRSSIDTFFDVYFFSLDHEVHLYVLVRPSSRLCKLSNQTQRSE